MTRVLMVVAVGVLVACGAVPLPVPEPAACGPTNCRGCCDRGLCREGTSPTECGGGGVQCLSCGSGRLCLSNACGVEPLPAGAKLVFVTRSTFTGDLGGLEGADGLCMAAAASGNLPGTFKAWLSLNAYDDVRRVWRRLNASERFVSDGPWYLPGVDANGRRLRVFASRAALRAAPLIPIDRTETLEPIASSGRNVWTGTLSTGLARSGMSVNGEGTCDDWTSSSSGSFSVEGVFGTVFGMAGDWTQFGATTECSRRYSLYCFED
jgi:hypothetical protein